MKAKVFQDTFEDIVKNQCLLKKNPIIIVSGLSDYIDIYVSQHNSLPCQSL